MSEMEYVREHELIVDRSDLIPTVAALESVIDLLTADGIDAQEERQILARLKSLLGLKENDHE